MITNHKRGKKIFWGIIIGVAAVGGFGLLFLSLWNWLMPAIFGLPLINFYQAVGLLILSKIIFSGFGKGAHSRHKKDSWRKDFEEKFSNIRNQNSDAGA